MEDLITPPLGFHDATIIRTFGNNLDEIIFSCHLSAVGNNKFNPFASISFTSYKTKIPCIFTSSIGAKRCTKTPLSKNQEQAYPGAKEGPMSSTGAEKLHQKLVTVDRGKMNGQPKSWQGADVHKPNTISARNNKNNLSHNLDYN